MLPTRTRTAICWRDGESWVVQVPELGRSASTPQLSLVEDVARELVTASDEDAASSRVVVDLRVRHSVTELITAAAALRSQADRVSVEAVTLRRGLARRLAAEGFEVRDVAALLGLSYGRTLQLVGEQHHSLSSGGRSGRLAAPGPHWAGTTGRDGGGADQTEVHVTGTDRSADDDRGAQPARPHSSFRHEAFLYRGPQEFLAGTLPFVQEALDLGQPVMVALEPERLEPLRAALPADAPVFWVDMTELGANPARVIPALRAFVEEHGGPQTPVRALGEPLGACRRPEEVVEFQLHEALVNLAVDPDTPLWLRCPYDVDVPDPAVLEEASRSHPALVEDDDYRGSLSYGGLDHAGTIFASALPEPYEPVDTLAFDDGTLSAVRPAVLARAAVAGLSAARSADLALAVSEAVTNSVRHGGGRGELRLWEQDGALVCEVRDHGRVEDPLAGRRMPAPDGDGGRGLWLVNQLSDLVQLRSTPSGTAVRVHSWLDRPAA